MPISVRAVPFIAQGRGGGWCAGASNAHGPTPTTKNPSPESPPEGQVFVLPQPSCGCLAWMRRPPQPQPIAKAVGVSPAPAAWPATPRWPSLSDSSPPARGGAERGDAFAATAAAADGDDAATAAAPRRRPRRCYPRAVGSQDDSDARWPSRSPCVGGGDGAWRLAVSDGDHCPWWCRGSGGGGGPKTRATHGAAGRAAAPHHTPHPARHPPFPPARTYSSVCRSALPRLAEHSPPPNVHRRAALAVGPPRLAAEDAVISTSALPRTSWWPRRRRTVPWCRSGHRRRRGSGRGGAACVRGCRCVGSAAAIGCLPVCGQPWVWGGGVRGGVGGGGGGGRGEGGGGGGRGLVRRR